MTRIAGSSWLTVLAWAVVAAFAASLCRRAIVLTDEGYLLSQVLDMMSGKVLYRDMDAFVSPGIWFFLAGLFELIEPSVLSSRILSFAGYLATLLVSFRIVARLTNRAWGWATVGLLMVFAVWAFPAWTLVFYSPFAVLFALAALERVLVWQSSRKGLALVLCGVFLGLSILCKQNYGAFAVLGTIVALVGFRFEAGETWLEGLRGLISDGLHLCVGGGAILLPTVGYFAYHGALEAIFDSLVLHPLVFMGRQDIPYPSLALLFAKTPLVGVDGLTYGAFSYGQAPDPFYSKYEILSWLTPPGFLARLHILLFWLPLPGLALGAWVGVRPLASRRPIDASLIAVLAMAAFVFLGVFPRADFNHLINVYQPILIATVLLTQRLLERSPAPRSRFAKTNLALAGALVFLLTFTAATWYIHALRAMDSPVGSRRGGVLVTSIDRDLIDFHVEKIREMTKDGDYVLTVPALAMFNFLAERDMPGRFYNLYEHHIAHDAGAGVVEAAEALGVDLVVSDYNNFFSDRVGMRAYAPVLAKYLENYFEPAFDVAGNRYRYLTRRAVPLDVRERIDATADCDIQLGDSVYLQEHLLFESLYQARQSESPRAPVDTLCKVSVPEGGVFAVSIGYRRPAAAARNASITAQVWISEGAEWERLLSTVIPVKSPDGWSSPPAKEFKVDLSEYAGRDVTLRFRSIFRGRVRIRMTYLDPGGYSLIWQGPHIEKR